MWGKRGRKAKKMMKAMEIFDKLLRSKLRIETLWGTDHIVIKDDKPSENRMGEILAISVVDFVELFQEPILKEKVSAADLKQYSKEKGLGWELIIDLFLSKVL